MYREHDLADDMPLGKALVRLVGLRERITFCDRDLQLRGLHGRIETFEFASPEIAS